MSDDKTFNASDPKAVAGRKNKEKQADIRLNDAYKDLLKNKEFRFVMYDLLQRTRLYQSSFTGNSTTFFNEGVRSVGLQQMEILIDADRESFAKILTEFGDFQNPSSS